MSATRTRPEYDSGTGRAHRRRKKRILVLTCSFPSRVAPSRDIFVKHRVRTVADLPDCDVRVVSPTPYFPPLAAFRRWYFYSQLPALERFDGLVVYRPRYFIPPKLGVYVEANLMYPSVWRFVRRLQKRWHFDLIDAHWAHPAGIVAVRLGQRFNKPVVITGRGEDIGLHTHRPITGRQIRRALRRAAQCIGVSRELAEQMVALGADAARTTVVPNGVDTAKFHPVSRTEARRRLGLPLAGKLILSVGDRYENKGFHVLIDALPAVRKERPDAAVAIVGGRPRSGRDFTSQIETGIARNALAPVVQLAGGRPHDELVWWYNAADVFALLSAHEGCPNVVLESLACGTPVVATAVGSVPDDLADPRLGIVLKERCPDAAAEALREALSRKWDRNYIRRKMEGRTWRAVAAQVARVFEAALPESKDDALAVSRTVRGN